MRVFRSMRARLSTRDAAAVHQNAQLAPPDIEPNPDQASARAATEIVPPNLSDQTPPGIEPNPDQAAARAATETVPPDLFDKVKANLRERASVLTPDSSFSYYEQITVEFAKVQNKRLAMSQPHDSHLAYKEFYSFPTDSMVKFDEIFDFTSRNCLALIGNVGVGKTIMCRELMARWARDNALREFHWVFFISLKDVAGHTFQPNPTMTEVLHVEYLKGFDITESQSRLFWTSILEASASTPQDQKILFILDDYDPISCDRHPAVQRLLSDAPNLIIISRSDVNLERIAIESKFEVLGFDEENIRKFINKFLLNQPESKQRQMLSWLKSNPQLATLCRVPMYLVQMCELWQRTAPLYEAADCIQLYHSLTMRLITNAINEGPFERPIDVARFVQNPSRRGEFSAKVLSVIEFFGKLAFAQLGRTELTTDRTTLEHFVAEYVTPERYSLLSGSLGRFQTTNLDHLLRTGLLASRHQSIVRDVVLPSYYFTDPNLSDYLSAYHVAVRLADPAVQNFISNYKYDFKYQRLMCFISRLVRGNDNAQTIFFGQILQAPRDLHGAYELILISRIIENLGWSEGPFTEDYLLPCIDKIIDTATSWFSDHDAKADSIEFLCRLSVPPQRHVAILDIIMPRLVDRRSQAVREKSARALALLARSANSELLKVFIDRMTDRSQHLEIRRHLAVALRFIEIVPSAATVLNLLNCLDEQDDRITSAIIVSIAHVLTPNDRLTQFIERLLGYLSPRGQLGIPFINMVNPQLVDASLAALLVIDPSQINETNLGRICSCLCQVMARIHQMAMFENATLANTRELAANMAAMFNLPTLPGVEGTLQFSPDSTPQAERLNKVLSFFIKVASHTDVVRLLDGDIISALLQFLEQCYNLPPNLPLYQAIPKSSSARLLKKLFLSINQQEALHKVIQRLLEKFNESTDPLSCYELASAIYNLDFHGTGDLRIPDRLNCEKIIVKLIDKLSLSDEQSRLQLSALIYRFSKHITVDKSRNLIIESLCDKFTDNESSSHLVCGVTRTLGYILAVENFSDGQYPTAMTAIVSFLVNRLVEDRDTAPVRIAICQALANVKVEEHHRAKIIQLWNNLILQNDDDSFCAYVFWLARILARGSDNQLEPPLIDSLLAKLSNRFSIQVRRRAMDVLSDIVVPADKRLQVVNALVPQLRQPDQHIVFTTQKLLNRYFEHLIQCYPRYSYRPSKLPRLIAHKISSMSTAFWYDQAEQVYCWFDRGEIFKARCEHPNQLRKDLTNSPIAKPKVSYPLGRVGFFASSRRYSLLTRAEEGNGDSLSSLRLTF